MKDVKIDKVLAYVDSLALFRSKCDKNTGWVDALRYCNDIHSLLMVMWFVGALEYKEYEKLCKKYKVRYKDLRRYILYADIVDLEDRYINH